jgi:choline dehydrogenase-like flavoprotein
MKNPHLEILTRRMREYHRHHPWGLSAGGLYIPHTYEQKKPDDLSHWDDVGFILNGRRYMVWWRHPRDVYDSAIKTMAWDQQKVEHGEPPDPEWMFKDVSPLYKRVGKSGKRKKRVGSRSRALPDDLKCYYAQLFERETDLRKQGVDLEIQPAWKLRRYEAFMGMELIAPMEILNEQEIAQLADLARQLVLRKITLAERFPVAYSRADWLREQGRVRT